EKCGKAADAAKEREQLKRLRPNDHAAELYKAGRYVEALNELQKLADKDAETYALMGSTLLRLNQWKDAASALSRAVKMRPDYAEAYFQLGNAYDRLNRQEDAAAAFREAARLNPNDADAL